MNLVTTLISLIETRRAPEMAKNLEITTITPLNKLGIDSLGFIELIMSVEKTFEINIYDEELEGMKTVGDIIQCLRNLRRDLVNIDTPEACLA